MEIVNLKMQESRSTTLRKSPVLGIQNISDMMRQRQGRASCTAHYNALFLHNTPCCITPYAPCMFRVQIEMQRLHLVRGIMRKEIPDNETGSEAYGDQD